MIIHTLNEVLLKKETIMLLKFIFLEIKPPGHDASFSNKISLRKDPLLIYLYEKSASSVIPRIPPHVVYTKYIGNLQSVFTRKTKTAFNRTHNLASHSTQSLRFIKNGLRPTGP